MTTPDSLRNAHNRRLAVLYELQTNRSRTKDKLLELTVYSARLDEIAEDSVSRLFEADLRVLRDAGYDIRQTNDGTTYSYSLDTSRNVELDATGLDLGSLSTILQQRRGTENATNAKSAMLKLVPTASTGAGSSSTFEVRVPSGEAITTIAEALQDGKRISFTYAPTNSETPREYVVEPWSFEVRDEAFFLRGWRVSNDPESSGVRFFKLDRIVDSSSKSSGKEVEVLDEPATFKRDQITQAFEPVDVRFKARPGTCVPLTAMAVPDGDGFALDGVNLLDLLEDLLFYGADVEVTGPPEFAADFRARLEHLAGLGGAK